MILERELTNPRKFQGKIIRLVKIVFQIGQITISYGKEFARDSVQIPVRKMVDSR